MLLKRRFSRASLLSCVPIDYWAVDWDFRNDTFMQGWVTYRTRKDRSLALTSDPHTYEQAGQYRILVKVVDIFGNDTSQAFDVDLPAPGEARQAGVR